MRLTILNVAYPLAPVGPDAAGGAEQVLTQLDRALTEAGHRSLVIAREGSRVAGTLLSTPVFSELLDDSTRRRAQARHRAAVAGAIARYRPDVVHLHGLDFHAYLPPAGTPALVTLHLPLEWYPESALRPARPGTWLHCVSASQRCAGPAGVPLLADIENGVPVRELAARHAKRRFVMTLGRICPEKGVHLALDAATRARVSCLVAGAVYPYPAHREYFRTALGPRILRPHRFLGPVGFARKRRLLSAARALLVPSLAPETSSLVAMEALACGTPVIAFRTGALPAIVDDRRTGFVVRDEAEMAEAIAAAARIDPETCRQAARKRYSLERMITSYLERYRALAGRHDDAEARFHVA